MNIKAKVFRCVERVRPMFPKWELELKVRFNPEIVSEGDLDEIVKLAGIEGFGFWRSAFGRFVVL